MVFRSRYGLSLHTGHNLYTISPMRYEAAPAGFRLRRLFPYLGEFRLNNVSGVITTLQSLSVIGRQALR